MDDSGIAPHRGFNSKARVVLIGNCDIHLPGTMRSNSDQNIWSNLSNNLTNLFKRRNSNNNSNGNQTPKSVSSNTSITEVQKEPPQFDSIGEAPIVKYHKQLGQIGKTMSCVELKNAEKRLARLNTYEDDNIIKMPSIDSDNLAASHSGKYETCESDGMGKIMGPSSRSSKYMVNDDDKAKGANKKK